MDGEYTVGACGGHVHGSLHGGREDRAHCCMRLDFSLSGALTSAIILLVSPRNSQLRAEATGGNREFYYGEHMQSLSIHIHIQQYVDPGF